MTTISLKNQGLARVLDQHLAPDQKLDQDGARDLLKSVQEGQGLDQTKAADLQQLLQSDLLAPDARKEIETFLAGQQVGDALPQAPVPAGERTSPAMAFFNKDVTQGDKPGQVDAPPDVKPPAPARPKTVTPPAAIGSTSQSNQTTGPLAQPLTFPANALIHAWAIPGSTVRVYNASVIENGKPKLLKEVTVPHHGDGNVRCMSGAYPTQREFNEDLKAFNAAPHDGMTIASIALKPEDDQDARDLFYVTMQSGSREESGFQPVKLHAYSAWPRKDRSLHVDTSKFRREGGKLVADDALAISPRAGLHVMKNGLMTELNAAADELGRFSLDLGKLDDMENVTIVATFGKEAKELDLRSLGLGRALPGATKHIAEWDHQVLSGFLQAPAGDRIAFQLQGIPDGVKVDVTNPNDPGKVQSFASKGGVLDIDVTGVCDGDALNVRLDTSAMPPEYNSHKPRGGSFNDPKYYALVLGGVSQKGGYVHEQELMMDGTYVVPNKEEAARIETVLDAFKGLRRVDLQEVLDLFGPRPIIKGGESIKDPETMRQIYKGAQLGSAIFDKWEKPVQAHVEKHLGKAFSEGFKLGRAYVKATRKALARQEQVGIHLVKQGERSMVITGGYSPISGSHGPLRPETVQAPSTYEVRLEGAPALTLQAGGHGPSGWVNPNAILMTFGVNLNSGATSFDYSFPSDL